MKLSTNYNSELAQKPKRKKDIDINRWKKEEDQEAEEHNKHCQFLNMV